MVGHETLIIGIKTITLHLSLMVTRRIIGKVTTGSLRGLIIRTPRSSLSRIRSRRHHKENMALNTKSGRHRVLRRINNHKIQMHLQHELHSPLGVVIVDLVGPVANSTLGHMEFRLTHVVLSMHVVPWGTYLEIVLKVTQ